MRSYPTLLPKGRSHRRTLRDIVRNQITVSLSRQMLSFSYIRRRKHLHTLPSFRKMPGDIYMVLWL